MLVLVANERRVVDARAAVVNKRRVNIAERNKREKRQYVYPLGLYIKII